jgi:hypothetical protein
VVSDRINLTPDTRVSQGLDSVNQVPEQKSVPAFASQAERGFGVPVSASKEKGSAVAADPKIYKAPNLPERNLYREFISI